MSLSRPRVPIAGDRSQKPQKEPKAAPPWASRPSPKRTYAFLIVIVIAFPILILAGLASYVFPEQHRLMYPSGSLQLVTSYPTYIAVGDAAEIRLTVTNLYTHTMTDTQVIFVYTDALPLLTKSDTGSAMKFGELAPGERQTKLLELTLKQSGANWIDLFIHPQTLRMQVWVLANRSPILASGLVELAIAPIPRAKWLFSKAILLLTAVIGLLAPLWVELAKETLSRILHR